MNFENCTPQELIDHINELVEIHLDVMLRKVTYERASKDVERHQIKMQRYDVLRMRDERAERIWERLEKQNQILIQKRNKAELEYYKFDLVALRQQYEDLLPFKYWEDFDTIMGICDLLHEGRAKTVNQALRIIRLKTARRY